MDNDNLYGGAGVDKLYGGADVEHFYCEKTDSGNVYSLLATGRIPSTTSLKSGYDGKRV